ncbi:MAG: hypothetical protein ACK47B_15970 [Armatimonadota bacterium]
MEPVNTLLYPLDAFYRAAGKPLPQARPVEGPEMPQPYRGLLVHDRDMTPTLERFHGERISLRLLERRLEGDALMRQVVLVTGDSGRAVEYGAIVIHCDQFPEAARPLILESRCPLGTILAIHQIEHGSCPSGFFAVEPNPEIAAALGLFEPATLYGRRNVLSRPDGAALAEVLEILPPLPAAED